VDTSASGKFLPQPSLFLFLIFVGMVYAIRSNCDTMRVLRCHDAWTFPKNPGRTGHKYGHSHLHDL
jgi:hypothetical protein